MRMQNKFIRRIVYDGMLISLYVVLSTLGIRFPQPINITITFASVATTMAALVFGPADAFLIGLLGEFLAQFMKYGITLTTPIWILPPAIRGLLIGIVAVLFRGKGKDLMDRKALALITMLAVSIITSFVNTAAMATDAAVYQYSYVFLAVSTPIRFASGLATATLVWLVAMPLYKAIRKVLPVDNKESTPAS